jgi:IS1562 transposase
MRQTIRDIEVNPSYRWFLGLSLNDKVSHFTTYGKNYNRRFQDKEVIEEFFHYVLSIVWGQGLIDPTEIFIDGTHIKATANNHKYTYQVLDKQARFMSEQLEVEIGLDRKKY